MNYAEEDQAEMNAQDQDRDSLDEDEEQLRDDDEDAGPALFSDGEGEMAFPQDTTAEQAKLGKDVQGIPWETLRFTREKYRQTRMAQYKNHENQNVEHDLMQRECQGSENCETFYEFQYNARAVKSTIVHFQLRNLVWATSKNDVYVMHNSAVNHWSPLKREVTEVMNLSGNGAMGLPELNPAFNMQMGLPEPAVQISTMCAQGNLLVAGGFHGEMVCKRLDSPDLAHCCRITEDENAITNAVQIFESAGGTPHLLTSNNDCIVREYDCSNFATVAAHQFPWPVNHTSVSPDGKLVVVVGDDPVGLLADCQTGKTVASLQGHADFSFASAWHPDGLLFATGNQDTTCRLWDKRFLKKSVVGLKGEIGAIRSIRFSSDGRFLAMAEPADFVHIFDVHRQFQRSQQIDLFGEIAGFSISPDGEALYIAVSDRTYGSLLEYNRFHDRTYIDSFV
eukprot:TRINITY_DN2988_c0_g2_i1.p1 TRINITY_DN2988_c0_g2~~TRINITY_DN2988_c0_g2_i1.p1  ORF type:complete len:451 (+),score=77.45 TRINITY_DN2988_c0_g2_i1:178-1530(+)